MTKMRWSVLVWLVVGSTWPLAVGLREGADHQSQAVFHTRVEMIQLDVVVTDENGHAVRGLRREDFKVLDRKQPRPIANFEEVSRSYASTVDPQPPPTVPRDVATNMT